MCHSPLRKQVNRSGNPLNFPPPNLQIYLSVLILSGIPPSMLPSEAKPLVFQSLTFQGLHSGKYPPPLFIPPLYSHCYTDMLHPPLSALKIKCPQWKLNSPPDTAPFVYLLLNAIYFKELSVLTPLSFSSHSLFNHSSLASCQSHQWLPCC